MRRARAHSRGPGEAAGEDGDPARPATPEGVRDGAARDRRSSRWDDHRRARRAELTAATVVAIRRHGADVGMSQVAAQARTSKTVVYRHFTDKAALHQAVCEQVAEVLVDRIRRAISTDGGQPVSADGVQQSLRAGIDAYLALIEADPEVYRYVTRSPRAERAAADGQGQDPVNDLATLVGAYVGDVLAARARREGGDRSAAPTWGHALVGMVRGVADEWLRSRPEVPRATVTEQLTELAWHGLSQLVDRPAAPV